MKSSKSHKKGNDIRLSEGTVTPLENYPTLDPTRVSAASGHLSDGTISPVNSVNAMETRSYQARREKDLEKKLSHSKSK